MVTDAKYKFVEDKGGYKIYVLVTDLFFHIDGSRYIVPRGFRTDLASIPFPMSKWIKRENDHYARSVILHDYLYQKQIGRFKADEIFFQAMLEEGTPLRYAIPFYLGVRLCGWIRYNKLKKEK
jgi:hypothetical protein